MVDEVKMNREIKKQIIKIASYLIDQEKATVLIPPQKNEPGYWFGGGNMARDAAGDYYLCGRYRNYGDSRTGLGSGQRGLELSIFKSRSPLGPYEKVKSFTKKDLSYNKTEVVSIEGTALYISDDGVELFISTEKDTPYPSDLSGFRKPGTGVWSIDSIAADSIEQLDASNIKPVLSEDRPEFLHVKDPCVYQSTSGDTVMIYCTHPFTWSSSNSAMAIRKKGQTNFVVTADTILTRGNVWDVAAARITDCLSIPSEKISSDMPAISLFFYDGAECLRPHEQNTKAFKRPRGYSCEEIGGLAYAADDKGVGMQSLSRLSPAFVSPYGTGCSRYVSTLVTDSEIIAIWQQSAEDNSQPLVANQVYFDEFSNVTS